MTGSFIPDGFDSVIKQEWTDYGSDYVKVYEEIKPYNHYCPVGEDIKSGELIFKKGTKIPLSIGNDLKAAATDALKKCAAEIGIAQDVYAPQEFKDVEVIEPPQTKSNAEKMKL